MPLVVPPPVEVPPPYIETASKRYDFDLMNLPDVPKYITLRDSIGELSFFIDEWDDIDRSVREAAGLPAPYKKREGRKKSEGASDGVTPPAKPELQIGDPLQDEPAAPTASSDKPYTITVELMFKQGGIAYGDIVNIEGQVWQWLSTTGQMHAMVGDEQLTVVQFKERYDGKTATVTPAEKDK